jgi:hypothetical protein
MRVRVSASRPPHGPMGDRAAANCYERARLCAKESETQLGVRLCEDVAALAILGELGLGPCAHVRSLSFEHMCMRMRQAGLGLQLVRGVRPQTRAPGGCRIGTTVDPRGTLARRPPDVARMQRIGSWIAPHCRDARLTAKPRERRCEDVPAGGAHGKEGLARPVSSIGGWPAEHCH